MKAICIIGSPNENGSTVFLVDAIIDGMKSHNLDVSRFLLDRMNIHFCKGCKKCEDSHVCVQKDDVATLIDGILHSDIVLLASPSYWGDVTGQMKVFIDRSLPLCNAKTGETPVPPGKAGVAVALRAGNSVSENRHIIETFEHYFGHLGIKPVARLTAEGVEKLSDLETMNAKIEEAYNLGCSMKKEVRDV